MSEWTKAAQRIRCAVEMDKPLTVRRERWTLVQGDKQANVIEAEVFQTAGKPYDLTGCTVTLTFVRPDHLAVPPITAEVNGNVAAATLTDACYRASGRYNALMQIAKDGADRTILWLVGDVLDTENDGMVDTEALFPTPEEMLVIFQQVEQAKQAANTAASAANKAANEANAAASGAQKWADTEAEAVAISAESQPTVDLYNNGGQNLIRFGIPAGKTPAITFRVATGAPGTQVQIQQSGTPEAPVIDLTIPRGDTGAVDGIDYFSGNPSALGTASPGTANGVARGDHVHPMPSASAIGALAAGGTAADASKLGGKAPEYYLPALSLLNNPDFAIAQAGYNEYHGNTLYHADRWHGNGNGTLSVSGAVKTFTSVSGFASLSQNLWNDGRDHGKAYTLVVTLPDGSRIACSGTSPDSPTTTETVFADMYAPDKRCWFLVLKTANNTMSVRVDASQAGSSVSFLHMDLFEGVYTADNAPVHATRPYAEELAACQRYFVRIGGNAAYTHIGLAHAQNDTQLICSAPLPQPMRKVVTPSVIKGGEAKMTAKSGTTFKDITSVMVNQTGVGVIALTLTSAALTKGDVFDVYVPTGSWLDISADL